MTCQPELPETGLPEGTATIDLSVVSAAIEAYNRGHDTEITVKQFTAALAEQREALAKAERNYLAIVGKNGKVAAHARGLRAARDAALAKLSTTEAALAESRGEAKYWREKLEQREAFLRAVDDDNDAEPWDQHDELRRLSMALEAVTKNDLESLHLAASVLYGTQSAIAREFLARKHALEAPHEST